MARDKRLFARLDLDYADHPKISRLSDAAFRAHVEMILYARKYKTDGIIPERFANRVASEALSELLANDDESPSLIDLDDGTFLLHGYADMNETREEIERRSLANSENGRRGGLAKAQAAKRVAKRTASKSLSETGGENVAETETETETDISAPAARVDVGKLFDQFWDAWPLKKGKKEARVAFEKAIKSGVTLEQILAGVENYKREIGPSPDWSKVKWPQGWLNGERWDDEPAPKAAPNNGYYQPRPEPPAGRRYAVDVASGVPLA